MARPRADNTIMPWGRQHDNTHQLSLNLHHAHSRQRWESEAVSGKCKIRQDIEIISGINSGKLKHIIMKIFGTQEKIRKREYA